MKKTGLSETQLDELKHIFSHYPLIRQVILYGSRAKGTYTEHSDIDLVTLGSSVDRHLIAEVLLDLADSNIPFTVDLQNYHDLKNPRLIDHINRMGITLYNSVPDKINEDS